MKRNVKILVVGAGLGCVLCLLWVVRGRFALDVPYSSSANDFFTAPVSNAAGGDVLVPLPVLPQADAEAAAASGDPATASGVTALPLQTSDSKAGSIRVASAPLLFADGDAQVTLYPDVPGTERSRRVQIRDNIFPKTREGSDIIRLQLDLFEDAVYMVDIDHVRTSHLGAVSVRGKIEGESLYTFVMTEADGVYRGELTDMARGRHYVIQYSAGAEGYVVTEYDPSEMPARIR